MPDRFSDDLSAKFMQIPEEVLTVIETLEKNGYEAYIVGGCVRDMLLDIKPKDFDICTSARPEQVLGLFPKCIPTGIKHGTVTVIVNNIPIEVTTYRTESDYTDFRHPARVKFSDSLTEDLKRRDFTINAMAYHPSRGIVDPFGGINDLRDRIIRTVGNPLERFAEDALRMLRAIRFQAVFGFSVDAETYASIRALSKNISAISRERILEELNRILVSSYPEALKSLMETKLLNYVFPVPFSETADLKQITQLPADIFARWAAFLRFTGIQSDEDVRKTCSELKMSNMLKNEIIKITKLLNAGLPKNPYLIRLAISDTGPESFARALNIMKIIVPGNTNITETEKNFSQVMNDKKCTSISELAVKGGDLISAGFAKPGKEVGILLNTLFHCVLQNPELNRKDVLMLIAGVLRNKFQDNIQNRH
mgnify:FL=1